MRNLATGNKMNFAIFTFIVVIILVILICAIVNVLRNGKETYQVNSSAFIYDNNYNYIDLENVAVVSKKWTGNYYLKEEITDKEYKLGNYAVSYDTTRNSIDLFGKFYQVEKGGNIGKITDYNTINSSSEDKFYKIDDRKYLIIAKNIKNDTGSLSTNNYLLVIIDRLGNAQLLNNEINAKTINEMVINTDDFAFDVANEKLIFNEEQIDLKKIIGSTNEYKAVEPEEKEDKEDKEDKDENQVIIGSSTTTNNTTTNNNSSSTTIIQNGSNINAGNVNNNNSNNDTTWVDSLNGWIGNVSDAFESIYNKGNKDEETDDKADNRSLALNSIISGTTYIDINYTINDPDNKYNVVYILASDGNDTYNIALDKKANTYRITDLNPDTNYTIQIGYKVIYSDATSNDTIEDSMTTRTLKPEENLKVTKVSLDQIYYTLKLDNNLVYDEGATLKFYINDAEDTDLSVILKESDLEKAASTGYIGSFKKPDSYTSISIELDNTKYKGNEVDTDLKTRIINY